MMDCFLLPHSVKLLGVLLLYFSLFRAHPLGNITHIHAFSSYLFAYHNHVYSLSVSSEAQIHTSSCILNTLTWLINISPVSMFKADFTFLFYSLPLIWAYSTFSVLENSPFIYPVEDRHSSHFIFIPLFKGVSSDTYRWFLFSTISLILLNIKSSLLKKYGSSWKN